MNTEIKISFNVSGSVQQRVEIVQRGLTPEGLIEMLNEGTAVTTVQDDGTIDITESGTVIAKVVEGMTTKSNLQYTEFDLD